MSYSFLDLAHEVLKQSPKPLTYQEIWQVAHEKGLIGKIGSSGKTPWQSLGARLYVEVRDNDVSEFIKVGGRPVRFFLKERGAESRLTWAARLRRKKSRGARRRLVFRKETFILC